MYQRAIFLDRDGVIIRDKSYMHDPADIEFLPGAVEGLRLLSEYPLIILTNQSGIARGYFSLEQAWTLNTEVVRRLAEQGIVIAKTYLCPHHPDFTGPCDCRKPKPGLARQAAAELDVDLSRSIMIGDRDADVELGRNIGARTILLRSPIYQQTVPADHTVSSLFEVAAIIRTHV